MAEISVGDRWTGVGTRLVEPMHDGKFTRLKFLAEYRYAGEVARGEKTARVMTTTYAVRYRNGEDPAGDVRLKSVSGIHDVSIQLSVPSGALSFMQNQVDETYAFAVGTSVQLKGFILTWFSATSPLNRAETADTIARKLKESGMKDVVIEQKKEGVSVSLNNIHFVAEQAAFLPDELPRLESLAGALKLIAGRSFRVIGHAAGRPIQAAMVSSHQTLGQFALWNPHWHTERLFWCRHERSNAIWLCQDEPNRAETTCHLVFPRGELSGGGLAPPPPFCNFRIADATYVAGISHLAAAPTEE